jgi:Glycosyl transferases group 1
MRVLYLDANGMGSRMVFVDTLLRGVLGYRDGDSPPVLLRGSRRAANLFALLSPVYEQLSYVMDWRDAFLASPKLQVEVCNINDLLQFGRCLLKLASYDLVVISHAAAGDDMSLLGKAAPAFDRRRGKLVVFLGNEYDLLDEKIAFIRRTGAEYVCSQLPIEAARYLYQDCGAEILEMPHALNPDAYRIVPGTPRTTDVGFVGDIYWPFVGDRERTELVEWFERSAVARGLSVDIRRKRVSREHWSRFLNGCKAVIGAESGTYYLNDRGKLLERARAYNLFGNRSASFDEVFDRFYRGAPRGVSGKSISSRHFEPIGTKTCQILLEGHYNGILKAGEHYISVRKDLSDIDEALRRFRDEAFRAQVVERAHEHVMQHHTYAHRVKHLLSRVI